MAPLTRLLLLLGLVQALGFAPPSGRAVSTRALRGPRTRLCSASGGTEAALADDTEMLRVEEGTLLAADRDAESAESGAVAILGLMCLIAAVCSLDRVVMAVAIIPMSAEYGFSDTMKGAISASFSVGYFGGLLPSGLLSTLLSPSKVVGAGLVLFSVAQFVTPFAASTGTLSLLAARAVMGLGEATAIPSLQRLASEYVPVKDRSRFWGFLVSSLSIGSVTAYALTPPLINSLGWPSSFEAYGLFGAVLGVIWLASAADRPAASEDIDEKPDDFLAQVSDVPWAEISRAPPVWALAVSHAASNFFTYFFLAWLPTYFSYYYSYDTAAASTASLAPFVGGTHTARTHVARITGLSLSDVRARSLSLRRDRQQRRRQRGGRAQES